MAAAAANRKPKVPATRTDNGSVPNGMRLVPADLCAQTCAFLLELTAPAKFTHVLLSDWERVFPEGFQRTQIPAE